MPAAPSRFPDSGRDIAVRIGLLLAGLASVEETACHLGMRPPALRALLRDLSLSDVAMVPIAIDRDFETVFLDMKGQNFDAPTFDASVARARAAPQHARQFRLPASAIIAAAPLSPRGAPRGIILHVGRCGSTLLCNLLSRSGWITLREPELCNTLFLARAATRDPAAIARIETLLMRLMTSLAHGAGADLHPCIVKLTSWTTALAASLPGFDAMRCIVIVRDPWSTIASWLAQPPYWYGDRPAGTGEIAAPERVGAARFFAQAWRSTVRAAMRLPRDHRLFLRYEDIVGDPHGIVAQVRRHLGDSGRASDRSAIAQVMALYSKGSAAEPFDGAGRHKRPALDSDLAALVTAITAADWRRMRAILPD